MYALTIRNDGPTPWVDLILSGEKEWEFRRWGPTEETIATNDLFAIHQADRGIVAVANLGLVYRTNDLDCWEAFGIFDEPGAPTRAMVKATGGKRPYVAIGLLNVRPIRVVLCRGRLGPWPLTDDLEMAVIERLAQGVVT